MNPWLSILIPVYNVEKYLSECLHSVLSQIDTGVEVIVVDDCSTDNSLALLKNFVDNSIHPITVLQHEHNSGLSAARNTLIEAAKGDYLWFLDSDDALAATAIQQLKKIITSHSPDLIMCDYEIWRSTPNKNPKKRKKESHMCSFSGATNGLLTNPEDLFKGLFAQGKLHAWSKISKRNLWNDQLRFPVGKYYEDMFTTPCLAYRASTYWYCPQVWIKYRQRNGSILSTPSPAKIQDMMNALTIVLPLWLNKKPTLSDSARFVFMMYCVRTYGFAFKDLTRLKDNTHNYKEYFRNLVIQASLTDKLNFIFEFLKRGKIIRLIRFLR